MRETPGGDWFFLWLAFCYSRFFTSSGVRCCTPHRAPKGRDFFYSSPALSSSVARSTARVGTVKVNFGSLFGSNVTREGARCQTGAGHSDSVVSAEASPTSFFSSGLCRSSCTMIADIFLPSSEHHNTLSSRETRQPHNSKDRTPAAEPAASCP